MPRPAVVAGLFVFVLALIRAAAADVAFQITDAKNAPVADAVVSLVALDATPALGSSSGPNSAPAAAPIEIVQQGKEFLPFVTVVTVGTTVNFPNRDKVEHQVYSLSEPKKFEFPLYKPGTSGTVTFERAGVVTLGCNIHDWMLAYVVILETPWFAKTDATGVARITAAPAGRYRAEVWQPRLAKVVTREVTVSDGAANPLAFTLTLKPERRLRRAPEAAGGSYK